jgi:hypothetical protein
MRSPSLPFLSTATMSIEKGPLLPSSAPPDPPQRQRTSFLSILSFSLIASFLLFSSRSESLVPPSHDHHALPVNGVNSAGLKWAVCPDTPKNESYIYYCSLFSVPTNWLEPVEGETTEVFMRMLKADKGKKLGTMLSQYSLTLHNLLRRSVVREEEAYRFA